jgi:hypothetical protein
VRTLGGSRTKTYTHESRSPGLSKTLNKRHGSRNRESKSSTRNQRESLKGILGVETQEEELASEAGEEDEDSEADATKCLENIETAI